MVRTVIFDIDNTLYSYDRAHQAAFGALEGYAAAKLSIGQELFARLHKEAEQELRAYMGEVSAVHNRTIRYQYLLEKQGLPLYPHVLEMSRLYWGTLLKAAEPFPGVQEAFGELKRMGLRIGAGTDMTAYVQFEKLAELGLRVDFLVSSEEAGAEKPSPAFFARCVEKAGYPAGECLFVGDSLNKDVYGPRDAGMKAVWYCPQKGGAAGKVLQLADFQKLPGMVEKMRQDR